MANRYPVYALDKVKTSVLLPGEAYVKLSNRAESDGITMAQEIVRIVTEAVDDDPWTLADQSRMDEIVRENADRREALRIRKGGL